jgi:hypothetical protein
MLDVGGSTRSVTAEYGGAISGQVNLTSKSGYQVP